MKGGCGSNSNSPRHHHHYYGCLTPVRFADCWSTFSLPLFFYLCFTSFFFFYLSFTFFPFFTFFTFLLPFFYLFLPFVYLVFTFLYLFYTFLDLQCRHTITFLLRYSTLFSNQAFGASPSERSL